MRSFLFVLATLPLIAPDASAQPLVRQSPTDLRVPIESPGASPRQNGPFPPGSIISMRDELENFPVGVSLGGTGVSAAPTSFTGPDGFEWGLNTIRGQSVAGYAQLIDLAGAPIGGNATRALQIRTANAQAPGSFFLGANIRSQNAIEPALGVNARASAELYISTLAEQYTFETAAVFTGYISSRTLWGGTCVDVHFFGECFDLGLPIGPIPSIMVLEALPNPSGNGQFVPARYCTDLSGATVPDCTPPAGSAAGDVVAPPIGSWSKWIVETRADNRVDYLIDFFNGADEVLIHRGSILSRSAIDRVGVNSTFESQDSFLILDNVEIAGPRYSIDSFPAPECPYHDDLEWMPAGIQHAGIAHWSVAPFSELSVLIDGARGKVLSNSHSIYSGLIHRREFWTQLPHAAPSLSNDIVASFEARFSGNTVIAFALFDGDTLVARVFRGYEDRTNPAQPVFTDSVFVQIDPEFSPLGAPWLPGFVRPVIGQHIEDTGVAIPSDGQYHTITLRLSASGALRVYVNDALAYAGPAAFGPSFDTLAFESANNSFASGAALRIDDIRMACDAPSCATDFDFDGVTSFADLNAALANFGVVQILPGFLPGDANGDGTVNFEDLNAILAAFGASCD